MVRSMATCLPFEILTTIFEQVDDVQDLRHVRIASRTLCTAAIPITFRVLSVNSTEEAPKILDGSLVSRRLRPMSRRSLIATPVPTGGN